MWPLDEPAAFSGLLAKGGCAYSASLDAGVVESPVSVNAGFGTRRCAALNPWPAAGRAAVAVRCGGGGGGQPVPLAWTVQADGDVFELGVDAGAQCVIERA